MSFAAVTPEYNTRRLSRSSGFPDLLFLAYTFVLIGLWQGGRWFIDGKSTFVMRMMRPSSTEHHPSQGFTHVSVVYKIKCHLAMVFRSGQEDGQEFGADRRQEEDEYLRVGSLVMTVVFESKSTATGKESEGVSWPCRLDIQLQAASAPGRGGTVRVNNEYRKPTWSSFDEQRLTLAHTIRPGSCLPHGDRNPKDCTLASEKDELRQRIVRASGVSGLKGERDLHVGGRKKGSDIAWQPWQTTHFRGQPIKHSFPVCKATNITRAETGVLNGLTDELTWVLESDSHEAPPVAMQTVRTLEVSDLWTLQAFWMAPHTEGIS
ncbi:hypothetical protein BDM02DRAFT_3128660 [Thelephora ganbajun]|uniref:Uncharacterized protein n=1 Tax=Thelephora ganbajun TaxID=370292 RepID=A0ACB6ZHF1_THEGA|nr:hypothetical protein BDM02DRAFT_3128660 [Thelephora ganbajun]